MLDESARECENATALDPGNYRVRNCVFTFSQLGNPERGMEFLRKDANSDWYNNNVIRVLWSEGKLAEARAAIQKANRDAGRAKFELGCMDRASLTPAARAELDRGAQNEQAEMLNNPDPENRYIFASDMAYCGEKDVALRLLKSAIEGHYCAYAGLQNDRLWAPLRGTPEFDQLLGEAKQCRDNFLAERAQISR
jgi:hypothetical protein